MAVNLKEELKNEFGDTGKKLSKNLERVRDKAYDIWENQRLTFFTDHKAQTHSEAIIQILGEMLEYLQTKTHQSLNAPEIYILLASSYLHDIGMQDLRINENHGIEEFSASDYMAIRKRHPKRSAKLIRQGTINTNGNEFKFNMPNPSYSDIVATVSQAHGSEYFESSVNRLKKNRTKLEQKTIRPDLLAALLMIADELHIDQDRANFSQYKPLSPLSELHYHANHYVTGVNIKTQGNNISIGLNFDWPNKAASYKDGIKNWLTRKLVKQIRRANAIIGNACENALEIKEKIEITENQTNNGTRRNLSLPAKEVLKRELLSSEMIDRKKLLATIRDSWLEKLSFKCFVIQDNHNSDWTNLSKIFQADEIVLNRNLINFSFDFNISHSQKDFLLKIKDQLFQCYDFEDEEFDASSSSEDLNKISELLTMVSSEISTLIIIEHIDNSDQRTYKWLIESFLPLLRNQNIPLTLLLVERKDNNLISEVPDLINELFKLENYSKEDISVFLSNTRGFDINEAQKKSTEIYKYTGGIPIRVLEGQLYAMKEEGKN